MIFESRIRRFFIALFVNVVAVNPTFGEELFHVFALDKLQTYSSSGEPLGNAVTLQSISDGLGIAGGVAFDDQGILYVSDFLGITIDQYSPNGEALGQWAQLDQTGAQENTPVISSAFEFDANGLLYAGLNGGGNDRIERFSADGSSLGIFAETTTNGSAGAILDIEFDSAGRLYATDSGNVERFDVDGNHLGIFASVNSNVSQLEFDSQGNLYFTTPDELVHVFSETGERLRQFEIPHDIFSLAISDDDLLYIAGGGTGSPGFVNVYDSFGVFQREFVSVDLDGNPQLFISTIVPEPITRLQLLLAAVLCVLRRRK